MKDRYGKICFVFPFELNTSTKISLLSSCRLLSNFFLMCLNIVTNYRLQNIVNLVFRHNGKSMMTGYPRRYVWTSNFVFFLCAGVSCLLSSRWFSIDVPARCASHWFICPITNSDSIWCVVSQYSTSMSW